MKTKPVNEVKHTFSTTEERDVWISKNFPERECTSTPGFYKVKGGHIGVFLTTVTVYK